MAISFDPFAPDVEDYSPEKVYPKAYDQKGHTRSTRIGPGKDERVNVLPWIYDEMARLQNVIPGYRSIQDVVRDLIYHGLQMRKQQLKGELPAEWHRLLDQITAVMELERLHNRKVLHEEILDAMDNLLSNAKSNEERYDAVSLCERHAMSMELPEYIRRANEMIERHRR